MNPRLAPKRSALGIFMGHFIGSKEQSHLQLTSASVIPE